MILSGVFFSNSALHEPTETRQHIDRGIYLLIVQLTVNENLSFRDVPCQIGDRMCYVVVGHSQNWQLSDAPIDAMHSACPFIDGRQIGV